VLPFAEAPGVVLAAALAVPAEVSAMLDPDVDPVVFAPASVTLFWTWLVALSQHCVFAAPAVPEPAVLEPVLVCAAAKLTAPAKSAPANIVRPDIRMDVFLPGCPLSFVEFADDLLTILFSGGEGHIVPLLQSVEEKPIFGLVRNGLSA
jgi:hypothetical protein